MFLRELDTPFPNLQYEPHFAQDACREALKLGFSSSHVYSPEFQRAVQPSAAMCMTVYPHLPLPSQYYICLYTTCAIYFDDLALRDASVVREFNALFLGNRKQHHPLLDAFAILLRTTSEHFSDICAAMIITSTLDYISALIVEQEQQDAVVHTAAANYPSYLRYLTGVARPYSLFLFPPNIPLQTYIQVLPT
ncbi:hypothetical protein BD779DRAFT_1490231 [Infundibulicybe gibba]|nr:hypothetical protein BD779DRAFT_1490231 [Infundibulicybe gibba]